MSIFPRFRSDGAAAAAEFAGFMDVWQQLPDVDEVLANPGSARVPEEPAAMYALSSALGLAADEDNMDAIALYAMRIQPEFGVLVMREAVACNPCLVRTRAFARWAEDNAEVLL